MAPTTMSIRQLICALADTEAEMRRSLRSTPGASPAGDAELADVLLRQRSIVAELRRRRAGRAGTTTGRAGTSTRVVA